MLVQICAVELKVYPVEAESLDEAKTCFSKESIQTEMCSVLVDDSYNGVAKHEGNERVGALNLVLNVDSRIEFKYPV